VDFDRLKEQLRHSPTARIEDGDDFVRDRRAKKRGDYCADSVVLDRQESTDHPIALRRRLGIMPSHQWPIICAASAEVPRPWSLENQ
jgi:hypothetical protein